MTLCILLTFYIFLAWYIISKYDSSLNTSTVILAAFVMACSQVVLTELVLGLIGFLHEELLFTLNFCISTTIIYLAIRRNGFGIFKIIFYDCHRWKIHYKEVFDGYNKTLFLLLTFSYIIIMTASYLLPPRGIDDLAYHLPVISEYTQSHSIKLLPVEIREAFAYPQNAEMLFLWPLVFTSSITLIDSINVLFVLVTILLIYALLRNFKISKRDAVFYSMLYALCPVVLMQAGSNYIDIILSLFIILSLYFTILFLQTDRYWHAWYAGLTIGMACGMKYTALFLMLPLQIIIIYKLLKDRCRLALVFVAFVFLMGGWWYLRNAIVLGNPLYPMNIFVSGMGFMSGSGASNALMDILINAYDWLWLLPLADIGIGTFDGGFGLVFWGLGFPSWLFICLYSLLHSCKGAIPKFLALMQLPIGLLILLMVPKHALVFNGRYALFIVPIGLLSLALIHAFIKDKIYRHSLKVTCVVFSLVTICLLSTAKKPSYRFDAILSSTYREIIPSEYLFSMDTEPVYTTLRHVWHPLDYLTRNDRPGIDCYIASNKSFLILSPIYGSNLQNNPITIGDNVPPHPDAFIYLHFRFKDSLDGADEQVLFYPKTKITQKEMLSNREYAVIASTELGSLMMSRAYLNKPGKSDILRNYYASAWPDAVKEATRLKPHLETGIPLVTADEIAYGLLYEELGRGSMDGVMLVPAGYEEHVARTQHLSACYTLGKPLRGYAHTKIETVTFSAKQIDIFLNQAI